MKENSDKGLLLIETASRLFSRKGYFQTSMKDIAHEAGLAVGTSYLYFSTKEDLLNGIYRHSSALLLERISARLATIVDPREKLRTFLNESVDFSFLHPDFFLIIFTDLRRSEFEFPQRPVFKNYQCYVELLRGILADGHKRGTFLHPASPALLLGIMGFWVAIVLRAVIDPTIKNPEALKRDTMAVAMSMLEQGLFAAEKR